MSVNTPDRQTFSALAKRHGLIPVYREVAADLETPISVFLKLCREESGAFLLESVEGGERVARYSFVGLRPLAILRNRGGLSVVTRGEATTGAGDAGGARSPSGEGRPVAETQELKGSPLAHLRQLIEDYHAWQPKELPRFAGGAVGYLSYDAVRYFERIPDTNPDDLQLPDALFMVTEVVAVFDHLKHRLLIIANIIPGQDPEADYEQACKLLDRIAERLKGPVPVPPGVGHRVPEPLAFRGNMSAEEFESAVLAAKEHIAAGDIFQVVLSQRLEAPLRARAFDVYRVLRTVNPSPYMFFMSLGDFRLIGASPEMMVRVEGNTAELRPIAGTRPRGRDETEDEILARDLLADEKERAEHVMLVDLGRNDLGRVCAFGTVEVRELMHVEKYSHVMHIVTGVRGRLRPGKDAFDALAACFPAGTLSGAPKVRAMQIIDELENTRRGPYGGAVGYFGFSGNMDTCITIRTIVAVGDRAYVQAGAGIVADSDPAREYQECLHKAQALIRALEVAEEGFF